MFSDMRETPSSKDAKHSVGIMLESRGITQLRRAVRALAWRFLTAARRRE